MFCPTLQRFQSEVIKVFLQNGWPKETWIRASISVKLLLSHNFNTIWTLLALSIFLCSQCASWIWKGSIFWGTSCDTRKSTCWCPTNKNAIFTRKRITSQTLKPTDSYSASWCETSGGSSRTICYSLTRSPVFGDMKWMEQINEDSALSKL